ncbi:MAG: flavin reductase family protein [Pseudomonadota bacterium]
MFYKPEDGHGLPHDPFKAIVAPRPIGWISTRGANGGVNLAPYSFFNAVMGRPPMVMFSSEGWKDSVAYASESGEFACNFVSAAQMDQMNETSTNLERGQSEFEHAGLPWADGVSIAAPHVANCAAVLECKVTKIIQQEDLAGNKLDTYTVFGQVVGVHIDDAFLVDGLFDTGKARPVMRLGYRDFGELGAVFQLSRPTD